NPAHLSEVLRGTAVWAALLRGLDRGMGYAGCSAGVACLTETTFDSDTESFADVFKDGLGLIPRTVFAPHWDIVDDWFPGAKDFILDSVPEGYVFVGLDEDTALLGDGSAWEVAGKSGIHVRRGDMWASFQDGDRLELALLRED
ncbi:MAG TPA: Type 1 glutamine amidotransferase-like domain-containing protein, partial [Actinomycetota bacterium]